MKVKALFLDRDGVLNVDTGYVHRKSQTEFIETNISHFTKYKDYLKIIVTNQSGIGRGYFTTAIFAKYMAWYLFELRKRGLIISAVFYCPHTSSNMCTCRKPKPGMFLQAQRSYNINMIESIMFGDRLSDLSAAFAAGVGVGRLIKGDIE